MTKIRFQAPQPYFKPSLLASSDLGDLISLFSFFKPFFIVFFSLALPQSIQLVVNSLNDEELKIELLQNIVLSGGGSTIHGFHQKLEQAVSQLYELEEPNKYCAKVIAQVEKIVSFVFQF
jgi:hypothetical protein